MLQAMELRRRFITIRVQELADSRTAPLTPPTGSSHLLPITFGYGFRRPHQTPGRPTRPPPRPQGDPRGGAPSLRARPRAGAERDGVPAAAAERPLVRLDPADLGARRADGRGAFRQARG